jgi:hypothetical protein
MSIQIITGFSLNSIEPIDTRIVASGSTGRDAIPYKYQGLRVFDLSNNRPYVYVGATWSVEVSDQVLGTTGSIAKFSSTNTVGNSNIYQVGSNIGINTSNPLGAVQFGSSTIPFAGYSLPFVIHQAGAISGVYVSSTVLGHNWYYNGSDQYFNSAVGSSTLVFGSSGDFIIQNRAGAAASFINSLYISPLGKVGIGTGFSINSTPGQSLVVNGTASATGFVGSGAGLTNISPSSILNQNLLSAGSALSALTASNVYVTNTTTNATYYPTFVSSGSSTLIRTNTAGLSYNPSLNTLTTGTFNSNGGILSGAPGNRANQFNLSSTTISGSNDCRLEFSHVRNTYGGDWLSAGHRIQAKVDSQYLGYVQFNGYNNEAAISFGTGYMSSDNYSSNYQRMRIDIDGRVNIGTASSTALNAVAVLQIRSDLQKYEGIVHRSINDANIIFAFQNAAGTTRGNIGGINSSSIAYSTTSDKRLKTNIQEMPSMYNIVKNLKPSIFNWKDDNQEDYGFIAQEVYKLIPNLRGKMSEDYCDVNSPDFDIENPIKKDGTEHYYGLDYGKLTPYLTKALQETMEKLETLTNKIKSANSLEDLKSSL